MRKTKPTDFSMALADYLFIFLPAQKGLSENTILWLTVNGVAGDADGFLRLQRQRKVPATGSRPGGYGGRYRMRPRITGINAMIFKKG